MLNNVSGGDRFSVATFFNPHARYVFEAAPTCVPAGATAPPPCSFGDHVQQRFAAAYGLTDERSR